LMGRVAADNKVATQMGNQGTASDSLRDTAAKIRAGALGTVKEVHVWSDRPIWPQGESRPQSSTPPRTFHWDEWIGPAHYRPFANGYHPISWRGFWDFGTGALGDMACHLMNAPFMALDLFDPTAVEATSSGNNMEMYPNWSIIKWEFPANANRPALAMYWYDGKKRPSLELFAEDPDIASGKTSLDIAGCLVVGDKGKYYLPGSYNDSGRRLLGGATEPKVEFTRSPGHFEEWVRAINGGQPTVSNFANYASKLTKTVLLGNLAVSAGRRIEWDATNMKATNLPDIDPLIRPHYRHGHQLDA
jgi:predicted dehydrogenase